MVWARIAGLKAEWGAGHVADCIRRGMAGEPDWFYAFEAGHVVGTAFVSDKALMDVVGLAAAMGGRFVVVMRPPVATAGKGANDGA